MDTGEWLTRGTVWLALTLYVAGEAAKSDRCGGRPSDAPTACLLPPHLSRSSGEGESGRRPSAGVVQIFGGRTFSGKSLRASRWLNTAGCAAFLVHVAAAFHFYHDWSHAAAYADTARQTAQFSGWNWGGGLYINYAFALLWLGETAWAWLNPNSYLHRTNRMNWIVRGFFLFMTFNGAVVFVRGGMKWFGLALCVALVGCWWRKRIVDPRTPSKPT